MDKRESEEFTLIGIVAEKRFKLSKKLEISSKNLKKKKLLSAVKGSFIFA